MHKQEKDFFDLQLADFLKVAGDAGVDMVTLDSVFRARLGVGILIQDLTKSHDTSRSCRQL